MGRAQRTRERSIKTVASPVTGDDYVITKVLFEDIIAELGDLPMDVYGKDVGKDGEAAESVELTDEQKRERAAFVTQNISKVKGFYGAVLKHGMVDPRVVDVVQDEEREVTSAQLGEDRLWLAEQIMEHSGLVGKKSEGAPTTS